MRFNSEAYAKAFPRPEAKETIETVVETFRPTTEKIENERVVEPDTDPTEDGDGDGDGSPGESDTE